MKAQYVKENLNEDLNALGNISVAYLSSFALSQIFQYIKKWARRKHEDLEEWREMKQTIKDFIDLIGEKDSKFKVMEFNDRYFLTTDDEELRQEIGDIRLLKAHPIIIVLDYEICLMPEEYDKLITMLKSKLQENFQTPFSNKERNQPISGSYPLSRIQYEDADKNHFIKCTECGEEVHPLKIKNGKCRVCRRNSRKIKP